MPTILGGKIGASSRTSGRAQRSPVVVTDVHGNSASAATVSAWESLDSPSTMPKETCPVGTTKRAIRTGGRLPGSCAILGS